MSIESTDPRKAWKEKDSAKRARAHEIKYPIPGIRAWLEEMRAKNQKEYRQTGTDKGPE